MKLTKMAGAFALTAAMAMASVPAFAAVSATNEEQFTTNSKLANNQADAVTEVYAETINPKLDATIPTRVAIVIPASGTGAIKAPDSSVYQIKNNTADQKIRLVKITAHEGQFKLTATANMNSLDLKLDAGTAYNTALDGTDRPVDVVCDAGQSIPLQLKGNATVNNALGAGNLSSAVMSITYVIQEAGQM